MLCRISDLLVEVPAAGEMIPRCKNYLFISDQPADICINETRYRSECYPNEKDNIIAYMESGFQFYGALLKYDGLYLHSSAVEVDGKAYLFSADCGVGKSTHTRLWQQIFGNKAKVFNDDKPALRRLDGRWYAYGTPWCGKDGININMKVPLGGICFLKQAPENRIRRLNNKEALPLLLKQTLRKFSNSSKTMLLLEHFDHLIREIPIFELENRPEPAAAQLSYETMRRAAEEAGL